MFPKIYSSIQIVYNLISMIKSITYNIATLSHMYMTRHMLHTDHRAAQRVSYRYMYIMSELLFKAYIYQCFQLLLFEE